MRLKKLQCIIILLTHWWCSAMEDPYKESCRITIHTGTICPEKQLDAWYTPSSSDIKLFSEELANCCKNPALVSRIPTLPGPATPSGLSTILQSILTHKKENNTLMQLLVMMKKKEQLPPDVKCPPHLIRTPTTPSFLRSQKIVNIDEVYPVLIPKEELFFMVNTLLLEDREYLQQEISKKQASIGKLKFAFFSSLAFGLTALGITLSTYV